MDKTVFFSDLFGRPQRIANADESSIMSNPLLSAVQKLRIDAENPVTVDESLTDDELNQPRPVKKRRKSTETMKRELERDFLTPPTTFGTEWLNRLQQ